MSEKNRDNKNRWRNVTIAFRMSPEENEELDLRVKLCGYQTRQEYIIESVLHQKVTAVGNPLMLVQFRKQLRGIEEELKAVYAPYVQRGNFPVLVDRISCKGIRVVTGKGNV